MDESFWQARWRAGRIGFHRGSVDPDLVAFAEPFLGDGDGAVLVPLCGKTVDLTWLASRRPTIGVELIEKAVVELHEEQGLEAVREPAGALVAWRSPGLTVLEGDVFDVGPEHVVGVDRVWDRAALVALDPPRRRRYVDHVRRLLPAGARVLLVTYTYDESAMNGPPHSVPDAEVRALYDGATVEILDEDDTVPESLRGAGHAWFRKTVSLITL